MPSDRRVGWPIALLTAALFAWLLAGPPAPAGAAGVLDPGFGGDGRVTTIFDENFCAAGDETADQAHAVAVQEDGKIVAAGRAGCRFSGSSE
jgi:hypothetical protein